MQMQASLSIFMLEKIVPIMRKERVRLYVYERESGGEDEDVSIFFIRLLFVTVFILYTP